MYYLEQLAGAVIMKNNAHSVNTIKKIEVANLFGSFTYIIPDPQKLIDISKLAILYGSNGTGKTTILRLVYHMLSPERRSGHRSYIASQPFHRFSVELSNGVSIIAERVSNKIDGSFHWSAYKGTRVLAEVYLEATESNDIPGKLPDDLEEKLAGVSKIIKDLPFQLCYLSDDRKLLGIGQENEDTEYQYSYESLLTSEGAIRRVPTQPLRDKSRGLPLDKTIDNLTDWIQSQVLLGASLGDTNVNTIYSQVISQIAKSKQRDTTTDANQLQSLQLTLDELAQHSLEFSSLGFIPTLSISDITDSMKNLHPETANIVATVLKPYLDSMRAKFNALEELKNLINLFLEHLNDFYINKTVLFSLKDKLRIMSKSRQLLQPNMLSSGEKQLLLIFSYVLMANDRPSIVIIDEPEISLNIKWQRKLINALLECMGNNPIQLLLASHSIELVHQYKSHVINLDNIG